MESQFSKVPSASQEREQAEKNLRIQGQKMRKKLLLIFFSVLAAMVLLVALIGGLSLLLPTEDGTQSPDDSGAQILFDRPFQGDIFKYEAYLALNPEVVRYVSDSGLGLSITEDGDRSFDDAVWYLCDFLEIMKRGDEAAYNACFNENYFASHSRQKPFSQQMIYEAEISLVSTKSASNGDTLKTYKLMYKLLQNDGSLRTDVGRNFARPQFVVLRENEVAGISIEDLYYNR